MFFMRAHAATAGERVYMYILNLWIQIQYLLEHHDKYLCISWKRNTADSQLPCKQINVGDSFGFFLNRNIEINLCFLSLALIASDLN